MPWNFARVRGIDRGNATDEDMEVESMKLLQESSASPTSSSPLLSAPLSRTRAHMQVVCSVAVVAGLVIALVCVVPIKSWLLIVSAWVDANRGWGSILLPVLLCIAIPLAIPATMLEILAGSAFGMWQGTLLNVVGKTAGAVTTFLIGKKLGRERLARYLQTKFHMFTALVTVVESPNWRPLVMIQLSSIPPVVKFYGLAITNVGVVRFGISAMIGGAPNALLWAYIGVQTKGLVTGTDGGKDASGGGGSRWLMMLIGVFSTVMAMGLLYVYTRRELNEQFQKTKDAMKVRSDSEDEDIVHETSVLISQATSSEQHHHAKHRMSA